VDASASSGPWRPVTLSILALIYGVVSGVAYTDYPRQAPVQKLSAEEQHGLRVWRSNNCQVCHQLYGFGGFLGPDLTNRVTDDSPDGEFTFILTKGSKQMPALDLPPEEQTAVLAFLRAMNRTGRSQPPPLPTEREIAQREHYRVLAERFSEVTGMELTGEVRGGIEVWDEMKCGSCHVPFTKGKNRAPDVSRRAMNRDLRRLHSLLSEGRGQMPAFPLPEHGVESLTAYLEWLAEHRRQLVDVNDQLVNRADFAWGAMPWFEYQ